MPSDVMLDITLREGTPRAGKGTLGACRTSGLAHVGAQNPEFVIQGYKLFCRLAPARSTIYRDY